MHILATYSMQYFEFEGQRIAIPECFSQDPSLKTDP